MRRRTVLAAAAAGPLSGCGGRIDRTETPPTGTTGRVEVADVREFAPTEPLRASVTVVQPWFRPDTPPVIELRLRNQSQSSVVLVAGRGDRPVFSRLRSEQSDPAAVVPTAGAETPVESGVVPDDAAPDGCWRLDSITGFYQPALHITRLDPNGTASLRVELWGYDESGRVCLPTGQFDFTEAYRFDADAEQPAFEWGFTLRSREIDRSQPREIETKAYVSRAAKGG